MADGDVHQQLHSLKDRINALTVQYSPQQSHVAPAAPLSPPASSEDAFTAQLRDVKAHLNTLQTSILACEVSMHQQSTSSASPATEDELTAHGGLTLPSGPAFWRLFNSLRSDFRTLDTRVAGLEQDVDALEDRVDKLEPDRFTPAGSTSSQEDAGGVQISQNPNEDLLGASMACLPELCSEQKDVPTVLQPGQYHSRISSVQSQVNDAFQWQWPCRDYWSDESVGHPYAMPMFRNQLSHHPFTARGNHSTPMYPDGVAFRDREIDRMDDQLRVVQESLQSTEALAAAKDTTMSDMQAQIESLQTENQRMAAQMAKDAQIKKGYDSHIRQLRRQLDERSEALRACEDERQRNADSHLQTIADRDFAIQYWQQRCDQEASMFQRSIADRDGALQRWEESYNAASDAWRQENERALALGARLDHCRSDRRKEIEQIHRGYEREMQKLKEFCEHKDAVIGKQEHVMLRGGRLLEERDAEIDRLQRRLRVAEDDMQHEGRQQRRMARLLDETQTELERLRSLSDAGLKGAEEASLAAQEQDTMAASTEAVDGRASLGIPGSFPRASRSTAERRPERRHSSPDRSEASTIETARNGSPRPRRLRRHESLRPMPHHHDDTRPHRYPRRSSPHPRRHRESDTEEHTERFVADKAEAQPENSDRRRARFLDDTISFGNPPLPAPVAARKMASEADLRSPLRATIRGADAERSLSKHRSLQELSGPRRRLQAYVETEGESDAEKDAPGRV